MLVSTQGATQSSQTPLQSLVKRMIRLNQVSVVCNDSETIGYLLDLFYSITTEQEYLTMNPKNLTSIDLKIK